MSEEQFYYYALHTEIPDKPSEKGAFVYRKCKDGTKQVLSPIFNSYHALKDFMFSNGFTDASQYQDKITLKWSSYEPFRLRLVPREKSKGLSTYSFMNPLSKKTQKLILPPKVVIIDNEPIDNEPKVPEIGLKDAFIQVMSGKIEKA